jgi:FkbM family methyltransferase
MLWKKTKPKHPVLNCLIAHNEHGAYCVPVSSKHRPAAQTILKGGVWEPDTIKAICEAPEGDIVHAGTYFGDFLPALPRDRSIWAFEPNQENWRCAQITKHLNGLYNVSLFEGGLGAERGQSRVVTTDSSGKPRGGNSTIKTPESGEKSAPVEIYALDGLVGSTPVGIIQLDVEGYELPALKGAIETIRRCRPLLILETVPQNPWFAENILSLGYEVSGKAHDNTILKSLR